MCDNVYTRTFSFAERKNITKHAIENNPFKVPVVLLYQEIYYKYLIPRHMQIAYLISIFRMRVKLSHGDGIFLLTHSGTMVTSSTSLESIYTDYKDEDGFLYLFAMKESMFGTL